MLNPRRDHDNVFGLPWRCTSQTKATEHHSGTVLIQTADDVVVVHEDAQAALASPRKEGGAEEQAVSF